MATATAQVDNAGDTDSPASRFANIIRPRRTWPGSRATIGGLLVAVAAIGLFAAFQQANSEPDTLYLVATQTIGPGTVLTAEHLGAQRMELPAGLSDRSFDALEENVVLGSITTETIGKGELLQVSDIRVGTGQSALASFEMSFRIDTDRAVNGGLRPGEKVNIVATVGSGSDAPTEIVLTNIVLLDVTSAGESSLAANRQVITIALDSAADSLSIASAADKGTLTLVRANES